MYFQNQGFFFIIIILFLRLLAHEARSTMYDELDYRS